MTLKHYMFPWYLEVYYTGMTGRPVLYMYTSRYSSV